MWKWEGAFRNDNLWFTFRRELMMIKVRNKDINVDKILTLK